MLQSVSQKNYQKLYFKIYFVILCSQCIMLKYTCKSITLSSLLELLKVLVFWYIR